VCDKVERHQHRFTALVAQCTEVRRSVVADNHDLAVDQERRRLDEERSLDDGGEAVGPVIAVAGKAANPRAFPAHH